jgi:hypothetical protein
VLENQGGGDALVLSDAGVESVPQMNSWKRCVASKRPYIFSNVSGDSKGMKEGESSQAFYMPGFPWFIPLYALVLRRVSRSQALR